MPDTSRRKKDYKKYELEKKKEREEKAKQTTQSAYPSVKASQVAREQSAKFKNTDQDKNTNYKKSLPTKNDTNPNKGSGLTGSAKASVGVGLKKIANDIKNAVTVEGSGKQPQRTAQDQAKIDKAKQQWKTEKNKNNKRRLDDYSKDIQNRAISGQNGTGVLNGNGNNALDKVFNPTGKFISNAIDSTINNSVPGAVYTFATGKHLTDGAYNDNPYEEQRHQGLSAMAGNMAGMALNYGLTRSAFNPALDKATSAIMNGTRLGNAIKTSSVVGKIGQSVGRGTAQDIANGLVKETLSDATIGFGQNAAINYGEGLRGSDFWRQQAFDTGLDFLVGGTMEGVGIGSQIRGANRMAKAIGNENVLGVLKENSTKRDYINELVRRHNDLLAHTDGESGRAVREVANAKVSEYNDEFRKVLGMTDAEFDRYKREALGLPERKTNIVSKSQMESAERLTKNPEVEEKTVTAENSAYSTPESEVAEETTKTVEPTRVETQPVETPRGEPTVTVKYSEPPQNDAVQHRGYTTVSTEQAVLDDIGSYSAYHNGDLPTPEEIVKNGSYAYDLDEVQEVMRKHNLLEAESETPAKTVKKTKNKAKKAEAKAEPEKPVETEAKTEVKVKSSATDSAKAKATKEGKSKNKKLASKNEAESATTREALEGLTNKQLKEMCSNNKVTVRGTGSKGAPVKKDYVDALDEFYNKSAQKVSETSTNIVDAKIKGGKNKQYYQGLAKEYNVELADDLSAKEMYESLMTRQKIAKEKVRTQSLPQAETKVETPEVKAEAKPVEAKVETPEVKAEAKPAETKTEQPEVKTDTAETKTEETKPPKKTAQQRAQENREAKKQLDAQAEAEKLSNADRIKQRQAEAETKAKEASKRKAEAEVKVEDDTSFDGKYVKYFDGMQNFQKIAVDKGIATRDFDDLAKAMGVKDEDKGALLKWFKDNGFEVEDTSIEGYKPGEIIESYEIKLKKPSVMNMLKKSGASESAEQISKTSEGFVKKPSTNKEASYTTTVADASNATKTSGIDLPQNPKRNVKRKSLAKKNGTGTVGKVGNIEIEGKVSDTPTYKTSVYEPHDEGKKGLWNRFYNAVFNNASTIDRLDKATGQGGKLSASVTMLRDARGQAGYMIRDGVIDINGKKVEGVKPLAEIFKPIQKDKAKMKDFEEYLYNLHNINRANNGKGIWGKNGRGAEESQNIVNDLLSKNKEFKGMQEDLDKFMDNLRQFMVDGGIIDKKTADAWKEAYPHYIPTFRNMGAKGGLGNNPRGAGSLLHEAKGSGTRELLPIQDQLAGQVERVVTAVRMNELKADMINLFANNPNAKAYGAVISDKSLKDVFGDISKLSNVDGEVDYGALVDAISKNAVEQIEGGKNTISAYINGRKVTAHVSNELFDTMRAIENAGNSDLITRAGKWITSPMKFTITGGNPVFTISNMLRDLPTLYLQSKHSMLRTTISLGKAFKEVVKGGEMYDLYRALGGGESGYYVRGKGFDTSLVNKNLWDKTKEIMSFIGEKGETIPRLAEFISTFEKTGNAKVALRDSAEATVDFARHGSSDVVRALDAWTLYLNAGMQGIDKFARTVKEHPARTLARGAGIISVPYTILTAMNWDNPHYQDLTERVKQNNFCVPNYMGEKDEQGRPMTFFKVPLNREYGTVLGASLDCMWRSIRGEDDAWKGFGETVKTNFLPSNPITDNVLAPLYFNIPENKDFAGRAIVSNALKDAPAKDQYDCSTSGFAKGVSKVANKVMGDHDFGILSYLKSPMLVDYLMDSYSGYYGDVLQTSTKTTSGTKGEKLKGVALDPFVQKFSGDARYSSKPVSDAYDLLDKYTSEKKHEELNGKTNSEAHVAYKAISNVITEISESSKAEKELMADPSLTKKERTEMIKDLREARNNLARDAQKAIDEAKAEYKEAPTYASMQKDTKAKWSEDLGMDKETWAKQYTELQEASKKDEDGNGGMTADEKRYYLLENGVKTYKQAQSLLGENTSKDKWKEAKKDFKNGKTFKDAQAEAKAEKEKAEAQKDMTKEEKSFENYFKTRVTERYDGKTVKQSVINEYIKRAKYADSQSDGNGSIKQAEAKAALDSMNLTNAQKAYIWSISNDWKRNPYG